MPGLFDYHTHSRFCDGRGEPAEYVEAAVAAGLEVIGLSSHAPCAFASDWHMKAESLPAYLAIARELQQRWTARIQVLVGLEADYVPGVISPAAVRRDHGLDYVMGGLHFLGRLGDGTPWTIDGPLDELILGVRESFGGDYKAAVTRYFELMAGMAADEQPDIIAHFDLIRKNNKNLFDEESDWYRAAATETLRAVAASPCVVEVNTGGLTRGTMSDCYPSVRILEDMALRRIPVTLGSDAHAPQNVAAHFAGALDALARAGYRECWKRTAAGWTAVDLETLAKENTR